MRFWGKRPLNGKFQNSATKRFIRTRIHVFVANFVAFYPQAHEVGVKVSPLRRDD